MQLPALIGKRKRIGRGISGGGAKSGRGMKGQRSRAGSLKRAGFEGGQTPLYQRLPKERGAKQRFSSQVARPATITVADLGRYKDGDIVGPGRLVRDGLAARHQRVKLIGTGELERTLTVRAHAVTSRAQAVVEKAGGKVELITSDTTKTPSA